MSHTVITDTLQPLVSEIGAVIQQARGVLVQQVNAAMVQSYWHIGRLIVEHEQQGQTRAAYGQQQLQYLSQQLTATFGKGFDTSNLRNMRQFFLAFPICDTVCRELSWSHYRLLMRIEDSKARAWYMQQTLEQHWSVRALERQISKLYYERLLSSQDTAPVILEAEQHIAALEAQEVPSVKDYIRDPIDLKLGKLSHQDVGQMDSYVRIYDQHYKGNDDNPTIGLILCSQKSEAVVKYSVLTDNAQLFAAKYLLYLPTEEELKRELEQERIKVQAQLLHNAHEEQP